MLRLIREISETVRLANSIVQDSGGNGPRWSVFLTNRSFVAQVFALIFAALALFGVPLPIPAEVAADAVYGVASAAMMLWAAGERLYGKTRVIWNRKAAHDAMAEANAIAHDKLSKALKDAGAL